MTPDAPTPESSRQPESSAPLIAAHPPTTPQAPAGFRPVCPKCKYDLGGSPDGACPECGTPFTHAGLVVAATSERRPRELWFLDLVIFAFWFILIIGFCSGIGESNSTHAAIFAFVLECITCGLCIHIQHVRRRGSVFGVITATLLCILTWGLLMSARVGFGAVILLWGSTWIAFLAFGVPSRVVLPVRAVYAMGLTLGIIGMVMSVDSSSARWYFGSSGPLSRDFESTLGVVLLFLGYSIAGILALIRSKWFRKRFRRSDQSDSSL